MNDIGAQVLISDQMINSKLLEQRENIVQRQLAHAFVERCLVNGTRVAGTDIRLERDPFRRSTEVNVTAQEVPDDSLLSLVGRMHSEQMRLFAAIENVNGLSFWRLLWLKLRRRPIVTWS